MPGLQEGNRAQAILVLEAAGPYFVTLWNVG